MYFMFLKSYFRNPILKIIFQKFYKSSSKQNETQLQNPKLNLR